MIRMRRGRVLGVRDRWRGAVELDVVVVDDAGAGHGTSGAGVPADDAGAGVPVPALAYPALVGEPAAGDEVLLNTGALALGLGTGGHALVVNIVGRRPADTAGPGHLVKARYTPLQATVLGVDEEASPHRGVMSAATGLDGMPVVVADLHSALPAVLAGVHLERPGARVAYVMTDGGALPLWYSRTVAALAAAGRLAGTVTVGQAFGGDLEAVTLHTGLLAAAAVLRADVTVVSQGPGNLGVGLPWGFSGVAAGEAVNAVAVLDGRAVGALRISDADPRERHRGISHHSRTAFGRVALARADVVVPRPLSGELDAMVDADLAASGIRDRHRVVDVEVGGLRAALEASPVRLSTMGRGLAEDESYFLAAAAAGRWAAGLASAAGRRR